MINKIKSNKIIEKLVKLIIYFTISIFLFTSGIIFGNSWIYKISQGKAIWVIPESKSYVVLNYNFKGYELHILGKGNMDNSYKEAKSYLFNDSGGWKINVKYIIIDDGINNISKNAFVDSRKLKYIFIPNSVMKIDKHPFAFCWNLCTINYGGTIKEWENLIANSATDWADDSSITTIICTDGVVDLNK